MVKMARDQEALTTVNTHTPNNRISETQEVMTFDPYLTPY